MAVPAPSTAESEAQVTENSWMKQVRAFADPKPSPAAPAAAATPPAAAQTAPPPAAGGTNPPAQPAQSAGQPPAETETPAAETTPTATTAATATTTPDAGAESPPESSTADPEPHEPWPRNKEDWAKFKSKRAENEKKLKDEIKTHVDRLAIVDKELAEAKSALEAAKSATNTASPELEAENQRLKKENEDYSQRLAVTEVTAHPKFQTYFKGQVEKQVQRAKAIVGNEKAEAVAQILAMPDSEYKQMKIEEVIADLTPLQTSQFGGVLNKLAEIEEEKQSEITKANDSRAKLAEENKTKTDRLIADNKKAFAQVVKGLQDAKDGNPMWQLRDGDPKWNEAVKARIADAEKLFFGAPDLKPDSVMKAVFNAIAFPVLLESYQAHAKAKDGEIAKLQEQVKSLSAAQPRIGASDTATSGGPGGKFEIKPGMNNDQVTNAWVQMAKRLSEG